MFFDFFKKKPKSEPQEPLAPEVAPESQPPLSEASATPVSDDVLVPPSVGTTESPASDEAPVSERTEDLGAEEAAVELAVNPDVATPLDLIQPDDPVDDASPEVTEEAAIEVISDAVETSQALEFPVESQSKETLQEKPQKLGFFARIKQGLARTSSHFTEGLGNLFLGRKTIDDELFEELETQLLVADVGIEATTDIIERLTARVARKQLNDVDALYQALREELKSLLAPVEQPMDMTKAEGPYVILVVGVNGVGKTTTIGKLAKRFQNQGKKVMLAAGDTFRAAAVEQLQVWGERNNVAVVAQHTGADSASVIFDALQAAKSRDMDVLIADTAGRLHNKSNLMEELAKVKRVMAKLDISAPHEVLLVLDAGTGQNAVNQTEQFKDMAGVTGLALTKLDGTAKGGVIFALSKKFSLPVRFIGVGEGIDDLQPFNAEAFVSALFDKKVD